MLEAINLTKSYGTFQALKGLNLKIEKGEVFCLLGQNGAGKTTTINIFLGLIPSTTGKALINGIEIKPNSSDFNKLIAYIPEIVQLYGNLSGVENLDLFSRMAGFNYSRQELEGFLVKSGLQREVISRPLSTYSKGMRQKVGISIALSKHAEVIFMDEPTSGLDPKATAEFTTICKELASNGTSIFMATHDIFNAVNVGTKIGIMKEGELVHMATAKDVEAKELQELYLKTI
ncbi:ATP-binding cassette domain-containing protein [Algoriphagus sp. D3-2-R+10]|uniref:ABC transporter ATP-binding protein n=1 Tax=Algoriphagus aurantiacus TaxID=3103948 RepID=UPI002B3B3191|nr:ATP-binding cassette domain-containing protein [Algoriphagus sp. D3-2-R+10]MEB2774062.1 ATP-binding cassette domain-containing protein [Algoriphagus sp. D3-2-R+10]